MGDHITALSRMATVVSEFRTIYPEVTASTVEVFLAVAVTPAQTSADLVKRIGVSQSAVSRHLSILGEYSWRGGEGLDLITLVDDPRDRRGKLAFLSLKGRQMAVRLARILDPEVIATPADFPEPKAYVRSMRF